MAKIKLQYVWEYNPRERNRKIGSFGEVFFGKNYLSAQRVAIKRLFAFFDDAGHREIDIAESLRTHNFQHILPILDSGLDENSKRYFVVMPVAEKSLQDEIDSVGRFDEKTAITILLEISFGLRELPNIVHRDLKPSNILFQDAVWKIADFGIARALDKDTSMVRRQN